MIRILIYNLKTWHIVKCDFPEEATRLIRKAKKKGYFVDWSCDDPEDNEWIWQKL